MLVTRVGLKKFFEINKIADQVIELDKASNESIRNFRTLSSNFNIRNIFCAHQSFRSAWILKDVEAQNKISYSQWWNAPFFSHRFRRPMNLPEPLRLMTLLRTSELDLEMVNETSKNTISKWSFLIRSDLEMRVEANQKEVDNLLNRLNIKKAFAVIAPSSQWKTKKWIAERFAECARELAAKNLDVAFVGSPSERNDIQDIVDLVKNGGVTSRNLCGETDLHELHLLMSRAKIVLANDSGSMHMAAAAGAPVVSIFGPTVLGQGYRPWSNNSRVVQRELNCRPCGKHGHDRCPIGTHECMTAISTNEVLQQISAMGV